MPTNFDSRHSHTRPYGNRPRPPPQRDAGERWQRGYEAKPEFRREQLDRELDRYGTKAQKEGKADRAGARDFDDWRKKRDGEWADDRKQRQEERNGETRERSRSRSPPPPPPARRADEDAEARGGDRRSEESDMVLDLGDD